MEEGARITLLGLPVVRGEKLLQVECLGR